VCVGVCVCWCVLVCVGVCVCWCVLVCVGCVGCGGVCVCVCEVCVGVDEGVNVDVSSSHPSTLSWKPLADFDTVLRGLVAKGTADGREHGVPRVADTVVLGRAADARGRGLRRTHAA